MHEQPRLAGQRAARTLRQPATSCHRLSPRRGEPHVQHLGIDGSGSTAAYLPTVGELGGVRHHTPRQPSGGLARRDNAARPLAALIQPLNEYYALIQPLNEFEHAQRAFFGDCGASAPAPVDKPAPLWGDTAMGLMLSDLIAPYMQAALGLPYAYQAHHTGFVVKKQVLCTQAGWHQSRYYCKE